jgi:periplasmic protein CpxP/Spy
MARHAQGILIALAAVGPPASNRRCAPGTAVYLTLRTLQARVIAAGHHGCTRYTGAAMDHTAKDTQPAGSSRRRWFAGLAALGALGAAGAAYAQGGRHHSLDPAERERRMEWRIDRLVQEVGGTPDQKERLAAIARTAMADLQPMREQARETRRQGMALLVAPSIDRAALERVRAARMQAEDARSRRIVQAMADASEVLTPEQRAKAAERLQQRMQRWRG